MKKLTLDVAALAVESFATDEVDAKPRGTVDAHAATAIRCGTGGASCFTSCRGDLRDACTCPPP
ncbi:MAG TPA: hypothetical protein VGO40_10005 [Longimicrobium sp.]|nr:hypothetical protein [Longimicrobium sp.]